MQVIVEAERAQVTKPDRAPDITIKPGHAIWWSEMIFMHVYGGVYKIDVDQENGSLHYIDHRIGERYFVPMPKGTKEEYDKYWYEIFESKMLGDGNG
jgi:hypothetical protein